MVSAAPAFKLDYLDILHASRRPQLTPYRIIHFRLPGAVPKVGGARSWLPTAVQL